MSVDYQALDEELDKEIMALYANESESETESDSPDETGTESQEVETESQEQELSDDDSTLVSDDTQQDDTKETVDADRYHNAVKAMNKAQQEAAELRKQIAGINQQDDNRDALIQQLQAQLQELQSKSQESTPEPESTPDIVDDEELNEAKEIYPEVVNPLLKIISNLEAKLSQKLTGVESEVGNIKGVADRYQKTEAETAEQKYWNAIEERHNDVREIVKTPEYAEWYHQQAPMIQKALSEGTAQDAVSALDLFRLSYPKEVAEQEPVRKPTNKPDKLAAAKEAAIPNIKGQQKPEQKPKFTQAQIAKMSREEFMKNEAAIDEAMASGEIY
jgi:hypothetical protein